MQQNSDLFPIPQQKPALHTNGKMGTVTKRASHLNQVERCSSPSSGQNYITGQNLTVDLICALIFM